MAPKKILRLLLLLLISLLFVACGQLSVGVLTPTATNVPVETQTPETVAETPESTEPTLEATQEPLAEAEFFIPTLAYVGTDNNLWLLEAGSESPRQLTFDANPIGGEGTAVEYSYPRLSGDSTFLAYRRDVSTPSETGYDFTSALLVENLQTGEKVSVLDGLMNGLAWKPGTHVLAYGSGLDTDYFLKRGQPDADLAKGIYALDLDTGENQELVPAERGYALSNPQWSPDGRFLGFTEVINMEGSGLFAYYDLEVQSYYAWDEAIGPFSWSPNGGLLTYSRQVYVATGEERLYLRGRQDSEQLLGPAYDGPAYATKPVFSPTGDRIAYLAFLEGPDTNVATIMVIDLASGEDKSFGQFDGVWEMAWVPDGSHLVFYAGPWETPQIVALNLVDGSHTVLAEGSQPALAGE